MRKQLLATALTGMIAFGAVAAGPGPNGNNDKGLCTAYFNGQKNGHDNPNAGGNGDGNGRQPGEAPGPFYGLEQTAEQYADDNGVAYETAQEAVYYFCMDTVGEIGGNPEHGRYDCQLNDTDGDGQVDESSCEDNPAPGNSGNGNGKG